MERKISRLNLAPKAGLSNEELFMEYRAYVWAQKLYQVDQARSHRLRYLYHLYSASAYEYDNSFLSSIR